MDILLSCFSHLLLGFYLHKERMDLMETNENDNTVSKRSFEILLEPFSKQRFQLWTPFVNVSLIEMIGIDVYLSGYRRRFIKGH